MMAYRRGVVVMVKELHRAQEKKKREGKVYWSVRGLNKSAFVPGSCGARLPKVISLKAQLKLLKARHNS